MAVWSLRDLCLQHLLLNLEVVLDSAGDCLFVLEPTNRALLLAGAKRTGLLGKALRTSLTDDTFAVLDCIPRQGNEVVTIKHVVPALGDLTRLKHLAVDLGAGGKQDVEGALETIARCCPELEFLELLGAPVESAELVLRVLPRLDPKRCVLPATHHTPPLPSGNDEGSVESWEERSFEGGKLERLRHLVWPRCPEDAAEWIQKNCARFTLHSEPPASRDEAQVVHGEDGLTLAELERRLDAMGVPRQVPGAAFAWEWGGPERGWARVAGLVVSGSAPSCGDLQVGEGPRGLKESIPIAERFRYAYILRRERVRREYDRERGRRKRRDAKRRGTRGGANLVDTWLDAV